MDLHWKLLGRYLGKRFDLETAGEMTWVELEGRPVRGFSAETTLIYLCAHGAKHLWPQLESVYAVARLVQLHRKMDWRWVDQTARRLGCRRMLHLGLYLAGELFGVYPPATKKGAFEADAVTIRLAEKIIPSLFDEPNIFQPNGIHPDFSSFHFRVRDRFADAMRHLLRLVFTPSKEDWHRFSLGGPGFGCPIPIAAPETGCRFWSGTY